MVTCAHLACRASAGHATRHGKHLWYAPNSFLVKVHGVRQVDVVARDGLVLGGDDVGLVVRLVLLAAVAAPRNALAGRSRVARNLRAGPTWRVDKEKKKRDYPHSGSKYRSVILRLGHQC